ncbi:MAG TPA: hypothetical protein VGR31_13975 [Planctomycetota bacterium]|jgi:hypothetical protein|nr:hypothetical protein [Planctomycetota bacterium]
MARTQCRSTARCVAITALLASCGGGGGGGIATPPADPLAIDLQTSAVSGAITLGGAAPPNSVYENGFIYLVPDGGIGVRSLVGETRLAAYQDARVLAGTYGTSYERVAGGQIVPANEGMPLAATADLSSDATFDVDVPVATLGVTFTLDGGAFPASAYENAVFSFRPVGGGSEVPFGESHDGSATVKLVPGIYDIFYSLDAGGSVVPANRHALVRAGLAVAGNVNVAIDVTSVQARFTGQLDGVEFPATPAQRGRWSFVATATGDRVVLGDSDTGPISRRVIPGVYDVSYEHLAGASVPANIAAIIATGVPVDAAHLIVDVDLHSALVSPSFFHDGGTFLPGQGAEFFLRGTSPGDTFLLGAASQLVPEDVRVVQGTYDVLYAYQFGTGIPRNARALVETGHVFSADGALEASVLSVALTPQFRHNGQLFPASADERAAFLLRGAEAGDEILLGLSNAQPGVVLVAPGSYDLYYRHDAGTAIPANAHHRLLQGLFLAAPQTLHVDVTSRLRQPAFTIDGAAPPASSTNPAKCRCGRRTAVCSRSGTRTRPRPRSGSSRRPTTSCTTSSRAGRSCPSIARRW